MVKAYSIFISHCWDYDDELKKLKELLNKEVGLIASYEEVTIDKPINSENQAYIRGVLKNRIVKSDIFIVVAGMYTAYSDWMQWEIETAANNNIPIIGIKPRGSVRMPVVISTNASEIVAWYTPSIISAIKNY